MDASNALTQGFEDHRPHLRAVAHRILGNLHDADDAVQEAWLRLSTSDVEAIDNLGGWLTTVVSRICLNMLRARSHIAASKDDSGDVFAALSAHDSVSPEDQAVLADSLGVALLVVLEQLSAAERICFVLHDLFSISFDEIASILSKSSDACRQLASRGRRRVRIAENPKSDPRRERAVVHAFLAAAKNGDFQTLLSLLNPDVVLVADRSAAAMGGPLDQRGPNGVAAVFSGRARAARMALIDGAPGLVWSQGGVTRVAFDFSIDDGLITTIEMIADPEVLEEMRFENLAKPEVD